MLCTFCPTMITDSSTSCRNVCAIQAMIPSPPGLSAAGRPSSAMIVNAYAHHIVPTTRVTSTANFALKPSTSPIAALSLRGVGCSVTARCVYVFAGPAIIATSSSEQLAERRARLAQFGQRESQRLSRQLDAQRRAAHAADAQQRRALAERRQRIRGAAHEEAAGALAEQHGERRLSVPPLPAEHYLRAQPAAQRALGEGHREAALGDVVGARERARAHRIADRALGRLHGGHVDLRQPVRELLAAQLRELARGQRRRERSRQGDLIALALEAQPPGP